MTRVTRNFIAGRMNKVVDERLVPDGEYIDAMNVRMGSTENSEVGVIENTKGNLSLTKLTYTNGQALSVNARCIGAIEDSTHDTLYWFVHDPEFALGATGKLDLIVSYNMITNVLTYNVISIDDGGGVNTTLNFNPTYTITGVNILGDLLFFTDNYNAPRVININRSYSSPVGFIDQFTAESILVIKRPPVESPSIQPFITSGQENFLSTRFISFAYRYRYIDGEYSAISQWSEPCFVPKPFQFSTNNFLNEGMVNAFNSVNVTYNSGSSLVVGVDLLFKQTDSNVIKVIEKLDKSDMGLANNTEYQYTFTNSKIFTILPDSELLRLYDNVPRYAKAQTIMGNRLMYGNYIEGYDMIDSDGAPVKLEYTTNLVSVPIGSSSIPDSTANGSYSIDGLLVVNNSIVTIDLTDKELISGAAINLDVRISHDQFTGDLPWPTELTQDVNINFAFYLNKSYASVYELATSTEFQEAVGTTLNIQTVANSCNGITFTDAYNCAMPNQLSALYKKASGINAVGQPIAIVTSPGSSVIGFQIPVMQYVDNLVTPTQTVYEYCSVVLAQASYTQVSNSQSLHSNRDYEIGIVYMDDFNRSTTALVSPNNTVHIPCGLSDYQNSIQVTIPATQVPPSWATRYKFVIKPDEENYETIYSSIFFQDPESNAAYFLLEGENIRKVETGDRLIVKADADGPTETCVYATVLEKESKASGFIEIPSALDPTVMIPIPAGVYMKINPNNFSIVQDENAVIVPGKITEKAPAGVISGSYPTLYYPMNTARTLGFDPLHPTWEFSDYDIPAGSRIVFNVRQWRDGVGGPCEERRNTLEKTFISSKNYDNMYDWFVGDNIELVLNDGVRYAGGGDCIPENEFMFGITTVAGDINYDFCTNYYRFYRNTTTNQLQLMITGTVSCTGVGYPNSRASNVEANITVFRADNIVIFETEPSDALPDVFFENNLSLPITNGNHTGNVQNQDISIGQPAIINTEFFNCFAFGNGAESYKIRDSIIGNSFGLGNRVTTVSAQDYKEASRFADITYSGIYNPESNVNKLNEFNLGLLNFKNLETSFGPIFILDGRQTDVLVLQEDKISYVLASKNLLSDSTGGSAVTSVPEVLGTQIARTEKYGISSNPESYVQWGYDRYFTDAKRGVVLQLRGDSYSNEQLIVVSEFNMRTWFRDLFNTSLTTQKLGGYDPYMNEYVLCSNDVQLPYVEECVNCGMTQTFNLSSPEADLVSYCVDLGQTVGQVSIGYNLLTSVEGSEVEIVVDYNGDITTSGWVSFGSGAVTFNKNDISNGSATITLNYVGNVSVSITHGCPQASTLNIVQIVLTNDFESGQTIHTEYRYTNGTYSSPVQSSLVTFISGTDNPLVSKYTTTSGQVGTGGFPPAGSLMKLATNKYVTDTFNFDALSDTFKYHVSATLYPNTTVGINNLLGVATTATPNQGGGDYNYATFTVPALNTYLYLIWDFRDSVPSTLCFSTIDSHDACCNCVGGGL